MPDAQSISSASRWGSEFSDPSSSFVTAKYARSAPTANLSTRSNLTVRTISVVVCASFVFGAIAITAGAGLSGRQSARRALRGILDEPVLRAIDAALDSGERPFVVVDDDLVAFSVPREIVVSDPLRTASEIRDERVEYLYAREMPPDPGGGKRTPTGVPRWLTNQLNGARHDRLQTAAGLTIGLTLVSIAAFALLAPGVVAIRLSAVAITLGWIAARGAVWWMVREPSDRAAKEAMSTLLRAADVPFRVAAGAAVLAWTISALVWIRQHT